MHITVWHSCEGLCVTCYAPPVSLVTFRHWFPRPCLPAGLPTCDRRVPGSPHTMMMMLLMLSSWRPGAQSDCTLWLHGRFICRLLSLCRASNKRCMLYCIQPTPRMPSMLPACYTWCCCCRTRSTSPSLMMHPPPLLLSASRDRAHRQIYGSPWVSGSWSWIAWLVSDGPTVTVMGFSARQYCSYSTFSE